MAPLSNSEFLKAAADLFEKSHKTRSSIYITQKRLIVRNEVDGNEEDYNQVSKFIEDAEPLLKDSKITKSSDKSYPILIRITDGKSDKSKKVKISTVVNPDSLSKFWREYSTVIKTGATGLKKKDKSKKKKKSSN